MPSTHSPTHTSKSSLLPRGDSSSSSSSSQDNRKSLDQQMEDDEESVRTEMYQTHSQLAGIPPSSQPLLLPAASQPGHTTFHRGPLPAPHGPPISGAFSDCTTSTGPPSSMPSFGAPEPPSRPRMPKNAPPAQPSSARPTARHSSSYDATIYGRLKRHIKAGQVCTQTTLIIIAVGVALFLSTLALTFTALMLTGIIPIQGLHLSPSKVTQPPPTCVPCKDLSDSGHIDGVKYSKRGDVMWCCAHTPGQMSALLQAMANQTKELHSKIGRESHDPWYRRVAYAHVFFDDSSAMQGGKSFLHFNSRNTHQVFTNVDIHMGKNLNIMKPGTYYVYCTLRLQVSESKCRELARNKIINMAIRVTENAGLNDDVLTASTTIGPNCTDLDTRTLSVGGLVYLSQGAVVTAHIDVRGVVELPARKSSFMGLHLVAPEGAGRDEL